MKIALITGASKGIGKEIALLFAKNNYLTIINYNKSKDSAQKVFEEITSFGGNAYLVKADITNQTELTNMFNEVLTNFGHIDILINNAGISTKGIIIDEDFETTQNVINTNLVSAINASKLALKSMTKNGYGKIINISSIWGNNGASCEATYSASKAGLIGLTKSLAKEYGYNNITVNCICPGVIDTDMNKNLSTNELDDIINNIPAKRLGKPAEIASVALFLAESTGDYINGQIITVDGGFTL